MRINEAIEIFASYSSEEKEEFLARLMHELTIVTRDSYEVGAESLAHPQRVRRINEVQHRMSAHLCALMQNDSERYPDDVLVKIILEHPDDTELERQLAQSFERLTTNRVTIG